MKFKHHLTILILLTFFVFYISVFFKVQLDNLTNNHRKIYNSIKHFEDNELMLHNAINQSIIIQYYNNDHIVNILKNNKQFIETFLASNPELRESYPKTFILLADYYKVLPEHIDTILRAVRINGTIKNSVSFLQNKLAKLGSYDQQYQILAVDIISNLIMIKSNLEFNVTPDKTKLEKLKKYKFKDRKKAQEHAILMAHMDLLYKELPKFSAIYGKIKDCQLDTTIDMMKKSIDEEVQDLRKSINKEFIVLIVSILTFVFYVYYFLIKNEIKNREVIELQEEKERDLVTDKLTGLGNRRAFADYVKHYDRPVVLLLNIIEFKNINKILGFNGGDEVLRKVSEILINEVEKFQQETEVFRIGSDEFAIVYNDMDLYDIKKLASSILGTLEQYSFHYNDINVPVYGLIGISGISPLLRNAQTAIETSKESDFAKITVYKHSMNLDEKIAQNTDMLKKVKSALEEERVVSFFQPIVSLEDKKPIKYESLVRIIDNGEVIPPLYFLDITKKSKLYSQITKAVIKNSIDFAVAKSVEVSINVTYSDINDPEVLTYIYRALEMKPKECKLTFELLENEAIKDYKKVFEFINNIRSYGCHLAIDDFGSGYSNYEYLIKFKPDLLKIDGALIKNIDNDENTRMIVKSLISFAKSAGIKTVAEFVHNEAIDKIITEMGVDYGQGFFYSPPVQFD